MLDIKEKIPNRNFKKQKSSISYIKGESEKDYQVRLLENQLEKSKLKIKKDYLDKLSLLLHDSSKYKNYPFKRNNINKIEYKYNENNELRLTFRKPLYKNFSENNFQSKDSYLLKNYNNRNEIKIEINNNANNTSINDIINVNYKSDLLLIPNNNRVKNDEDSKKRSIISNFQGFKDKKKYNLLKLPDNIKKILYNNDEQISLKEQRKIYNRFKNKFPFFRNNLNNQLDYLHFNSDNQIRSNILSQHIFETNKKPKIRLVNNNRNLTIVHIINTVNELRALRDKVKINKNSFSEENLLTKIRKESILTPKKKIKKKLVLSPYEVFYYNSKKWKRNFKKNNKKEIHFNEINKQIEETIKEMKNKVIILNQEIFKLEDVRNKMKSQNKLVAVKSKSFRNFKSHFLINEEKKKLRRNSRFNEN